MAASIKVNMDALIRREDFYVEDNDSVQFQAVQTIQIRDLDTDALFFHVLRKPDFQRETSDWTPEKIAELIESYLKGDLIPSIILWNSGSYIFVIDGAHRLSALIAWVLNDYGDGPRSRSFLDQNVPEDQISSAEKARLIVRNRVGGDYLDHKIALQNPEKMDQALLDRARRLASLAIQVQWVRGDARKAEASFFKINRQATVIDPAELRLIRARRKPNGLAARAILHAGTGHKYWSGFEASQQQQIENVAKEIHTILFTPSIANSNKTIDLPIAGKEYSTPTLKLVLEFVNFTNGINASSEEDLTEDNDGKATIEHLRKTQKFVNRMSGTHPSSLGLHPAVYFYGENLTFQPTAFLAVAGLLKELDQKNNYRKFTEQRQKFESFILNHKDFANQVAGVIGSGVKGMKSLQTLYQTILDCLVKGKAEKEILEVLLSDERFRYLKLRQVEIGKNEYGRNFSRDTKATVFFRESMRNALRCQICQGFININSISFDHVERKADGGVGSPDNAQLSHPYCNTTYKH